MNITLGPTLIQHSKIILPTDRQNGENMTYCISDIHGEYELFMSLLERIGYSDSDRLIVCGDLIDKGKASVKLAKTVFNMPNAHCIMGNHEYTFFKFYRTRMHSAIIDFDSILAELDRYFPDNDEKLDWDTVDMLTDLPYYFEDERFVCVHAGAPLDENGRLLPLDEATPDELVNDRRFKEPYILPTDSKCVIFGHTPTVYTGNGPIIMTYPRDGKNGSNNISDYYKIRLDTGVGLSGVLGCFRVDDCQSFYVDRE